MGTKHPAMWCECAPGRACLKHRKTGTKAAQTVAVIDRIATRIAAGEGTVAEQWRRLNKRERALFDSRADYLHAVMAGIERMACAA